VFGAICPARDTGAALVLPRADGSTMQLHLDQVSRCVADGAHAVLTLDKAGWHTTRKLQVPFNISLVHLPHQSAREAGPQSVKVRECWYEPWQMQLGIRAERSHNKMRSER
jgi:hypothetical protein